MFWWIGDSTVHMNRVPTCQLMHLFRRGFIPMLIPYSSVLVLESLERRTAAPRDNAATRPLPSANPPEAIYGIFNSLAALAS
jgi:hypothetical protein